MTREQNFQYEMFVRVRDYGIAERDLFPESSTGGLAFARVTAAVAAIDEALKNRALASRTAVAVKAETREALFDYMKDVAQCGRRVTRTEPGRSPFRMPRRRTLAVGLSAARAMIEEARKRQDQFVELGLPPALISDFQELVDRLQYAVDYRISGEALRRQAREGLKTALAQGLDVIRDLDVVVMMATRQDPTEFAVYQSARYIEGPRRRSRTAEKPAVAGQAEEASDRKAAARRRRSRAARRRRAKVARHCRHGRVRPKDGDGDESQGTGH